jgi:DNA-binding transcriptional ArsR family regulator
MNRSTITRRSSRSALFLADEHAAELADLFRLLGDPTRLRIVLTCLDAPTPVGEIADRLDLSASLVSHHLRLLRAARIVRSERHGKQVFYAAADDHVRCVVVDMLEHVAEPQGEED